MKCQSCGTENENSGKFCTTCGEPLASLKEDSPVHCPDCGTPCPANTKFCSSCGCNLAKGAPAAGPDRAAAPRATGPAQPRSRTLLGFFVALVFVGLAGAGAWWFLKPSSQGAGTGATASPAGSAAPASATKAAAPAKAAGDDHAAQAPTRRESPARADTGAEKTPEQNRPAAEQRRRTPTDEQKPRKAEAEAPAAQARATSTREQVAECQKQNFFKREICMIKACNNKWGRDGCPAYEQKTQQEY